MRVIPIRPSSKASAGISSGRSMCQALGQRDFAVLKSRWVFAEFFPPITMIPSTWPANASSAFCRSRVAGHIVLKTASSGMRAESFGEIANDGKDAEARAKVLSVLEHCVRLVGQNRHLYVFGPEVLRQADMKVSAPAQLRKLPE